MMYVVYIIYSKSLDRYYVGHTANFNDRLKRHNAGSCKPTKAGVPWSLMRVEKLDTKSMAYRRELKSKQKNIESTLSINCLNLNFKIH